MMRNSTPTKVSGQHGQALLLPAAILLCCLQYFAAEAITAAAWVDPPYDWLRNYISDLGVTDCSVGQANACSPLFRVMNAGFVLQGLLLGCGGVLLSVRALGARGLIPAVLLGLSGAGTVLVGLAPGSVEASAGGYNVPHVLGAVVSIAAGNIGILALGILARGNAVFPGLGPVGILSIALGIVGMVGFALFATETTLGLGIGLVERIAVNTLPGWAILSGALLLATSRPPHRPRAPRATQEGL